jgi:iron(III) transport system permease protein
LLVERLADDWTAAIVTTLALMAISVVIAVAIGVPAAASVSILENVKNSAQRPAIAQRLRRALVSVWVMAMLFSVAMPLILHAAVWESTAGKFGWLMKTMTGGNLFWVGWIHGVHGAAIVAIATYWGTRNIAAPVIQHAAIDFGVVATWFRVRLPIAAPWVAAAVVIVSLLSATEMSVADLHSVRTVADQFYLFYALDPNWTAIAVATWVPLIVGGIPAIVWLRSRIKSLHVDGSHRTRAAQHDISHHISNESTTWFPDRCVVIVALFGTLGSLLICQGAIAAGLLVQAGHTVRVEDGVSQASWTWQACCESLLAAPSMFLSEYAWTLQLAGLTAIVVLPLAWALARAGRASDRFGWAIDCSMTLAFLIPGPVVAMAIVWLFTSGIPGGELLATQTLIPTMMSVGVRSLIAAYFLMRLGYGQISESVWQASRLDGGFFRRVCWIELPLLWTNGVVALIVAGVVASGDVPAALPVLPPGVTTVSTRLFGLLHSGSRYQEASLAFWYLVGILSVGSVAWWAGKRSFTR